MNKAIIEVCNVSKQYRLGEFSARSLRDEAEMLWNKLWKTNGQPEAKRSDDRTPRAEVKRGTSTVSAAPSEVSGQKSEVSPPPSAFRLPPSNDFWALRDVSFTVQPGEVLGIIGRNGAGKSTLLKILSRITEPTEGEVVMRGRVASLLEVGTGFHPELSGRENIYLNGAILGMKKREIDRKFDEIITFAEVERFIDTPVKRYSSGMYVRLAFAVAAHLEPEILVIDEVLAVGDAEFQRKCLGKMQEVSSQHGRTVLFVSHQLAAIRRLCTSACLLSKGGTVGITSVETAIDEYTQNISGSPLDLDLSSHRRPAGARSSAKITRVRIDSEGGLQYGEPLTLIFTVECSTPINNAVIGAGFDTLDGYRIMTLDSDNAGIRVELLPGENEVRLHLRRNPLHPAMYLCGVAIMMGGQTVDAIAGCATWEVIYGPNVVACDRGFAGCRPAVEVTVLQPTQISAIV